MLPRLGYNVLVEGEGIVATGLLVLYWYSVPPGPLTVWVTVWTAVTVRPLEYRETGVLKLGVVSWVGAGGMLVLVGG